MPKAAPLRKEQTTNAPLTRPLTKSRFKEAFECATKLYYTKNKAYGNEKVDDPFLKALADGGFQVGALAKLYHPEGIEVVHKDYEKSLEETRTLMMRENVTIFEGAFSFGNTFVRADIVIKTGKTVKLLEVKAKSWAGGNEAFWLKDKAGLQVNDLAYLYDVAFQWHVIHKEYQDLHVIPYLYLADKEATASIDGLNQKFILKTKEDGSTYVHIKEELKPKDLGTKILREVDVREEVGRIIDGSDREETPQVRQGKTFEDWVSTLAESYLTETKIAPKLSNKCKKCEYRIKHEDYPGLKSGFDECWKEAAGTEDKDKLRPRVFDIWNNRNAKKMIQDEKTYYLDELEREDFIPPPKEPKRVSKKPKKEKEVKPGLEPKERQWLQVEKYKAKDQTPYFDKEGFEKQRKDEQWKYPYHFIDFETAMAAIPFYKGRRPYEQIAFQFSHQMLHEDGTIEHKGEWINFERGKFPNFDFVRALKKELEIDNGTIFRYATHENTVLCQIYNQLSQSNEKDKEELQNFIKTITYASDGVDDEKWEGPRDMVDMLELVKRYYYDPRMKGSNSIKFVLPAMLASSKFLQEKYAKPIYGTQIKSLNFKEMTWVRIENGEVKDPYKLLPKVFEGNDFERFAKFAEDKQRFLEREDLKDGGAAMMAYAKMQFTEMPEKERIAVKEALLRYCELDTLAMVMIWEGWGKFK